MKETTLLLTGGLLIDPASQMENVLDIRIESGEIQEVAASLSPREDETIIDARGLWITPGFIDIHTHLRDFGQSDRETIETGTAAAAAGGYTTVLAMANTDPPLDSVAMLTQLKERIAQKARVEVLPVACVTRGMAGAELTNMVSLAEAGVYAFSDDGMPVANLAVLRRALEYSMLADRLIISHAEDKDLSGPGVIHEGVHSTRMGLPGYPGAAESAAIAREIEVVREAQGRLHFAHVSCAASVELIRTARAAGLRVSADATPHHLVLSVEDIKAYDSSFKMNPPLRTAEDQKQLIAGLKDGTISAIATDHAPHTKLDKSRPMDESPFGIIGLETAFALCLQRLHASKELSALEFIALLTTRPAALLNLPQPSLSAGSPANVAVLDPACTWVYDVNSGHSRSKNSPFHGRTMLGRNLLTIAAGKTVYKDMQLLPSRLKTGCPSL